MVNVGSLPQGGQSVFDYDTQGGVTHILASIRAAEISPEQKNELRDLVFLYSNGGMDQRVRTTLEQKISAYGLKPAPKRVVKTDKKPAPEQPTIGKFRTAPTFSVPRADTQKTEAPVTPDFTKDATWQKKPVASTSQSEPAAVVVEPVVVYTAPAPVGAPNPISVEPTAPAAELPVMDKVPEALPVTPTPPPVSDGQEDALNRIREIKSLVNSKVGNPVNLVDIDNEVGREYMSALLDAMKKINSGSSATSAMSRLENAYQAVEHTLEGRELTKTIPPEPVVVDHTPEPEPKLAPVSSPVLPVATPVPASKEYVEEYPTEFKAPIVDTSKNQVPIQNMAGLDEESVRRVNITSSKLPEIVEVPASVPELQPEPKPVVRSNPPPKVSVMENAPLAPIGSGFEVEQSNVVTPVPETRPVTAVKPLATLADLSQVAVESAPVKKEVAPAVGDPLHTPEVDTGLAQLLEEWPIFKKSGLFGTGPKGVEHPLFKKMATLQIPLLLAGRFEGATQEIKQSITDYMNGWRYEQGLIYEQGETFEHYLRRVIRHILDLQKSRL